MHKIKATKREMKQNYFIIGIGYCSAQYLLKYENPIAYSSGVYGWACDYYDIDNVVISTGYGYLDNKNTKYDYKLLKKYEAKASAIQCNHELGYKEIVKKTRKLLRAFFNKCKGTE